jgi:hypothetical protein
MTSSTDDMPTTSDRMAGAAGHTKSNIQGKTDREEAKREK